MNKLIDEILTEVKAKHSDTKEWWNTKHELEKILDSEFKVLRKHIEDKDLRIVNLIYLGKVKPSKWLKDNKVKFNIGHSRENKKYAKPEGDISRLEELSNQ